MGRKGLVGALFEGLELRLFGGLLFAGLLFEGLPLGELLFEEGSLFVGGLFGGLLGFDTKGMLDG